MVKKPVETVKNSPSAADRKKEYQSTNEYSKEEKVENFLAFAAIAAVVLVIVGLSTDWFGLTRKNALSEQFPPTGIGVTGEAAMGAKNAPVLIVELSDFECPFCGQFERETFPLIKKEYIDTGQVIWFYMELPLPKLHKHAYFAAIAAECAKLQGKFWPYHDILFQHQKSLEVSDLKAYANQTGLDLAWFNRCLDANETAHVITDGWQKAHDAGISATPSFVIGKATSGDQIQGFKVVGVESFETFQKLIDAAKHKKFE